MEFTDYEIEKLIIPQDNIFSMLTKDDLKQFLKLYYSAELSVKELLEKYQLNIKIQDVAKNLPKVQDVAVCPYDGNHLLRKMPSRTSQAGSSENSICPKCGHTIFSTARHYPPRECHCDGCLKKKEEEREKFAQMIQQNNEMRTKYEFENLDVESRLYLAVILQKLHATKLTNVGPYSRHLIDERLEDNFGTDSSNLIEKLYTSGVLVLSPLSDFDVFTDVSFDKQTAKFNLTDVAWDVWVQSDLLSDDILLQTLTNPNKGMIMGEAETTNLHRHLVLNELKRLFYFELARLHFEVRNDAERECVSEALKRWSAQFHPSEIYYLIYISVRRANDKRTSGEWGNYKFHQIQFIVNTGDNFIMSYSHRHKPMQQFGYPTNRITPLLETRIFFEQMLIVPNWFNQTIPSEDGALGLEPINSLTSQVLDKMLDQREDAALKIPGIISDAKWFSIRICGVVINDGNVDWLYADQLTAYGYAKQIETTKNQNLNWTERIIIDGSYYIQGFYSFNFLIKLIRALKDGAIAEKT